MLVSSILANSLRNSVSLQIELLIDSTLSAPIDGDALAAAARLAAKFGTFDQGEIGIRVTDDPTIRQVNRQHLQHDYPTDVISFAYVADSPRIEGELILSFDTAYRRAAELGWDVRHELILYTVHGVLHLSGMDDRQPEERAEMRAAERAIMLKLGIPEIERFGADTDQADLRLDLELQDRAAPANGPTNTIAEPQS